MAWSTNATASGRLMYQGQPGLPDPGSALTLSQAAGSSSLSATTYYVQYDLAGALASGSYLSRTTTGSSQNSIAVSTAGNVITTSITLPTVPYGPAGPNSVAVAGGGVGIYVGTASNPLLLGTININPNGTLGSITYSGSATSGLSATLSGNTLNVTISAAAASNGAAATSVNNAYSLLYTSPPESANVTTPSATALVEEIVVAAPNGQAALVLSMGNDSLGSMLIGGLIVPVNDVKWLTGLRTALPPNTSLYAKANPFGNLTLTISGSEVE